MDNGQLTIKNGENVLKQKSYFFALDIVKVCLSLQEKREFVLSKQLLRSGTAIGALVEEANETHRIRSLIDSEVHDSARGEVLLMQCTELIKLLTASIKTSKLKR